MFLPRRLVPCSSCGCHARSSEARCLACGAQLRAPDGAVARSVGATLLGLAALALPSTIGCGGDTVSQPPPDPTGNGGASVSTTSRTQSSSDHSVTFTYVAAYGPPPTHSAIGAGGATDGESGARGGAGGHGGAT
jgi:hypothetical protein